MRADETKEAAIIRLIREEKYTWKMLMEAGFKKSKIYEVTRYFRNTNEIFNPNHVGRPKKIDSVIMSFIESQTLQNPHMSIETLQELTYSKFNIKLSV